MAGRSRVTHVSYSVCLAAVDFVAVVCSFVFAYRLRFSWLDAPPEPAQPLSGYLALSLAAAAVAVLFYGPRRMYADPRSMSLGRQFQTVLSGSFMAALVMMAALFLMQENTISRLVFLLGWATAVVLLISLRVALYHLRSALMDRGIGVSRLMIVGTSRMAATLAREVRRRPEMGYRLAAVEDFPQAEGRDIPMESTIERVDRAIRERRIDEVIVALPSASRDEIAGLVQSCRRNRVRMKLVPEFFDMALSQVEIERLDRIPLLSFRPTVLSEGNELMKRALDILLVVPVLILLSPLLVLVSLAIKLDSPGPVIYRQTRVGREGRLFQILKFRSMRQDAEALQEELMSLNECEGPLFKMRNDPRMTRVGRFLRRTSLDELPQLFNVLRGEMSLVGPRPPVPAEVSQYEEWQLRRLDTTPGITGLWQVSGRSNLSFSDMVNLDLYYMDNWSVRMDFTILLQTLPAVATGRGAY